MYKRSDTSQHTFLDFNQPLSLHMDPANRWVRMADRIPWDEFERRYAGLFESGTGNPAKPLRLALGCLIIQARYQYPDRELVEQLKENPYYQYFIGLPGYQEKAPIDASTLVLFRRCLTADILREANEYLLERQDGEEGQDDGPPASGGSGGTGEEANSGTLILDATCSPVNIRYPQDFDLLNEAREKLEATIIRYCKGHGLPRPRMYRRQARKDYLALAKMKKRSTKKIRAAIRRQLSYVRRDLRYVGGLKEKGYVPKEKEAQLLGTIEKVYEQQEYMYRNRTHSVADRIVSISQPWIRPIVRGKAKTPVEFGAKLDLSIDGSGYGRIEKISFDAYNECGSLEDAAERYRKRTGHYPMRILADQIYRTRDNRRFCKERGIRLSGPKLGRPSETAKQDKKKEYQDNVDRIGVERAFSLCKRCYGMGLIVTKLEETQLTSIALSVFVMNLFKIQKRILSAILCVYRLLDNKYTFYRIPCI